ncbi:MAG TPA: cobalt ECF transporter T component CbiQ [Anaerolineae bacterium]|nr:cobalt ECF transporter T component CbiQ [Anaerolineae bacterium]
MHIHFLDPYRPRHSLIHALDPRVKFVFTLAFVLTMALLPIGAWPIYVLMLTLSLSIAMLSELGLKYVLKRSLLAVPFVLAAVPLLFTVKGPALLAVPIGSLSFTITAPGLERLLSIMFKSWVSLQVAIVFAAATPFPDMLLAMRAVKIPRLIVSLFGLMWRYMFVMVDEAIRLLRARASRSGAIEGRKSGGSIAWRARVTGGMAGNLFVRSLDRGERIYAAMAARGYDGEIRLFPLPPLTSANWITTLCSLGLLAVLWLIAMLFWG